MLSCIVMSNMKVFLLKKNNNGRSWYNSNNTKTKLLTKTCKVLCLVSYMIVAFTFSWNFHIIRNKDIS